MSSQVNQSEHGVPELRIASHIRWLIGRDMEEVMEIENSSFDDPWTPDEFTQSLRQRSIIGMVAECHEDGDLSGKVIGYMIYEL